MDISLILDQTTIVYWTCHSLKERSLEIMFTVPLTLSLLGTWKPGYAGTPPPSKSHVWCPNMTNDTSLESSCALLLEPAKNVHNCKNRIFYRKYSKNVCKKHLSKKLKIMHFWKALDHNISNMQEFLQNFT